MSRAVEPWGTVPACRCLQSARRSIISPYATQEHTHPLNRFEEADSFDNGDSANADRCVCGLMATGSFLSRRQYCVAYPRRIDEHDKLKSGNAEPCVAGGFSVAGGSREDTCDHGLSRRSLEEKSLTRLYELSWKIKSDDEKKEKKFLLPEPDYLPERNDLLFFTLATKNTFYYFIRCYPLRVYSCGVVQGSTTSASTRGGAELSTASRRTWRFRITTRNPPGQLSVTTATLRPRPSGSFRFFVFFRTEFEWRILGL